MIDDATMRDLTVVEVDITFATKSRGEIALMFDDLDLEEFEAYRCWYATMKDVPEYFDKYLTMFFKYSLFKRYNGIK